MQGIHGCRVVNIKALLVVVRAGSSYIMVNDYMQNVVIKSGFELQ